VAEDRKKRAKAGSAKHMKANIKGSKDSNDVFGDTTQPKGTMTKRERAEMEARAKQ